jgi:hypothetical protein
MLKQKESSSNQNDEVFKPVHFDDSTPDFVQDEKDEDSFQTVANHNLDSSERHVAQRSKRCTFFNTPNGCNKGDNCTFSHVKAEPTRDKSQLKLCEFHRHGRCPNISTCPDYHAKSLCKSFNDKGQCTFNGCTYRHWFYKNEYEENSV